MIPDQIGREEAKLTVVDEIGHVYWEWINHKSPRKEGICGKIRDDKIRVGNILCVLPRW